MGAEMNGLLVIDKPAGMTSRDVVNRVQQWFPRGTKVGHTGTLDPLATGVLVICVGAATKLADVVQAMGKTYRSQFRLGATSDTDDADGTVTLVRDAVPPTEEAVRAALARFVGDAPWLAYATIENIEGVHALVPYGASQTLSQLAKTITGNEDRDLGIRVEVGSEEAAVDLSSDGRTLAYRAPAPGSTEERRVSAVYIRRIDEPASRLASGRDSPLDRRRHAGSDGGRDHPRQRGQQTRRPGL